MANIQIDEELFRNLLSYFFSDEIILSCEADEIRKQLEDKLDKLISRELFTKYKRAATPSEREAARQEYLNHRNILSGFRSNTEVSNVPPKVK